MAPIILLPRALGQKRKSTDSGEQQLAELRESLEEGYREQLSEAF